MPTIIDVFDYVIALRQQIQQKDIQIQQLQAELEILKKGKKQIFHYEQYRNMGNKVYQM